MISTLAPTIPNDEVVTFQISEAHIQQFLDARTEGGPLLECFEGSATLVSPGRSHESMGSAFPFLSSAEVLERLDDPEIGDTAFLKNCWAWVNHVLMPRLCAENGGA